LVKKVGGNELKGIKGGGKALAHCKRFVQEKRGKIAAYILAKER